jgi:predicted dinucleotide-binding enzyme
MNKNVNLIIGSGVIGAYLTKLLLSKKDKVIVTS